MTHLSNYGNDRLALFLFEHAVDFVQRYTNLQLVTEPPLKLAEVYFNLFPNEKMPVWTVSIYVCSIDGLISMCVCIYVCLSVSVRLCLHACICTFA